MNIAFLLVHILFIFTYNPKLKILVHNDCIYSKALITLLDWSDTKYKKINVEDHINLLGKDKHVPKVYINNILIGGYQDSLKVWFYIYKKLPVESNFNNLFNPEYVISKFGKHN